MWRAAAGHMAENNSGKSRHETQLTEHHSWNMAVESSGNGTHDKAERGEKVAPAGDPKLTWRAGARHVATETTRKIKA